MLAFHGAREVGELSQAVRVVYTTKNCVYVKRRRVSRMVE